MQPFFKGTLSLICDAKIVCDIMMKNGSVRVITLDEDNAVPALCDENNPQVVAGTILLPPVEALWAEADGQSELFQNIYYSYLMQPEVMQYISGIFAALYQGSNLIMYFPDYQSPVIKFLYQFFIRTYGLIISTNIAQPFQYDENMISTYCNMIYSLKAMTIQDYLIWYPLSIPMPDQAYFDIADILMIPGDNIIEQRELIDSLHRGIHRNHNVKIPFVRGRG